MGKLKRSWSQGTLLVLIVFGLLFTGVILSHYSQEKAINKSTNPAKHEPIHRALAKGPAPESIRRDTKDGLLEKEQIRKHQEEAIAWRNQQERDNSNVKEPTPAEPASNPTTTTEQPTKITIPAQSEQPNTPPPANPSSKKTIYLTFDDGPSAYSAPIITLLEKYQYKATFFMIDGNIRRYPNAVKLMVQSGETVGLHSVSHNRKIFYASVTSIISELTQNRLTLKEISGVDSYIMRTPYGSVPYMTEEYRKAVDDQGYLMWDWNIDSRDWDYKDARYVNSVIAQLNRMANHNGPIVILLHERKETLAHLPQLLDFLSKQGWISKEIDSSMTPVQFNP
ncbi:polysaccharide deacetylase [Neobacillus drentensis]|uniref:polysaccharide deacetylase family protein n=1 Tax=Neobacillus drentensis TaxID=220684 RepID=UPI001F3E082D|nr:polysaccharide deacetylase family protein [Neobacillus drentensis]ULT56334.1 polysaccharide deacetylase [Neobacillus drentensis]